ncbi:glycosyltransferase family protein [Lacunimicrobium album]
MGALFDSQRSLIRQRSAATFSPGEKGYEKREEQMRVMQVCNVGTVCGGTGGCAWSVRRALPEWEHHVVFLSAVTAETLKAFDGCGVYRASRVGEKLLDLVQPEVVVMHNAARSRVDVDFLKWGGRSIQYLHSKVDAAGAKEVVCCSEWLAKQVGVSREAVLWQGVPGVSGEKRPASGELVVGRIATPVGSKWPGELVGFYGELAVRCPGVRWEFVGCPQELRGKIERAVGGRAVFYEASFKSREHMAGWDVLLHHQPGVTESFGRTVAEGMLAGCVPVVDARGGFCEQVVEGTGVLCRDVDGYVAALMMLGDREVRVRMRNAAREHAERAFSLAAFRERLLSKMGARCVEELGAGRKLDPRLLL